MSELALTVLLVLLIPAGLLPVVTSWYLKRYRHDASVALRDRWYVSLVLAAVGFTATVLATLRLLGLTLSGAPAVALAFMLLLADIVSAKWLVDYYRDRFVP